jgi:hypothetical protein
MIGLNVDRGTIVRPSCCTCSKWQVGKDENLARRRSTDSPAPNSAPTASKRCEARDYHAWYDLLSTNRPWNRFSDVAGRFRGGPKF